MTSAEMIRIGDDWFHVFRGYSRVFTVKGFDTAIRMVADLNNPATHPPSAFDVYTALVDPHRRTPQ